MTDGIRATRRTVLAMAGSLVVTGAAKAEIPFSLQGAHLPEPLQSIIRIMASAQHSATMIGRAYLQTKPHEGEQQALVRVLLVALSDVSSEGRDPSRLGAEIKRVFSRDFAKGQTVTLDGWVMSLTEARLCALRALAHPS
jgi:hypothetical protein